jgi:hypothetical protein
MHAAFKQRADCSGRAVLGVHEAAYETGWSAEDKQAVQDKSTKDGEPVVKRKK